MFKNFLAQLGLGTVKKEKQSSTGCILLAPVFIFLAFFILFKGETFQKSSIVVQDLPLEQAADVTATEGMHKIAGDPEVTKTVTAPEFGEVLYYSAKTEEYKEVEEKDTRTEVYYEDGVRREREVEQTKIVDKWVQEDSDSGWGEFKLGEYTIKPAAAKEELLLDEAEYRNFLGGEFFEHDPGNSIPVELGDERILLSYLAVDAEDMIVIGEIQGDTISGGEVFIVSNKSDGQLLQDLEAQESLLFWASKIGAFILLSIGFQTLFAPILILTNFIPIAGKMARSAASGIAGLLAFLLVIFGTIVIKFFWIIIVLCGLVTVGLVFGAFTLIKKNKGSGGSGEAEKTVEND
ncbi:MAG TPA: hypothetical protein ENI23_07755 [bacterium]|nr:hypothetical protein [bacterium]